MAKPVVAGRFRWPTRSAAKDEFTALLRESGYGPGDRVALPLHDEMLRAIVSIHPRADEKIGSGIDHFAISTLASTPGRRVATEDIGFRIHRTDGTKTDFSYNEAIEPSDHPNKVKKALRTAVDDLRLDYRDRRFAGSGARSDVSGTPFATPREASVIYEAPTFAQLAFRFSEAEGGWNAIEVESGGTNAQIGELLADETVEARWRDFYAKHAKPLLATKSEAARRPRPSEEAWTP